MIQVPIATAFPRQAGLGVSHFRRSRSSLIRRLLSVGNNSNNSNKKKNWFFADYETPQKEPKRIVFLGTPEVAATTLEALYQASLKSSSQADSFEISAVVTQPPKRKKRKVEPSPVQIAAEALKIPYILTPEKANDKSFLDLLEKEIRPHLCITAAYGQYLPKRFLATPTLGTVNIHPSLLPKWRGASPVQRSLQAGDNPVGVTVLYTVSKMDAGPIVAQQEESVKPEDTATNVLPFLFHVGTDLLLDALPRLLQGDITFDNATPQKEEDATSAALIHSSEGELQVWQSSATECHNQFRGFHMWPGVFLYLKVASRPDPLKIKVVECRVVPDLILPATCVVELGPNKKHDGLYVVCHDGSVLELMVVQPATKRPFPARDLLNGYPDQEFQWTTTPDDYETNPQKYNARQRGSNNATTSTTTTTSS